MTDEKLLEIQQSIAICSKNDYSVKNSDVYDLITALRAERAKVAELQERIDNMDGYSD